MSSVFQYDDFYRATLCVSAVLAVGRCLSVRPSVCYTHVLYPNRESCRQTSFWAW